MTVSSFNVFKLQIGSMMKPSSIRVRPLARKTRENQVPNRSKSVKAGRVPKRDQSLDTRARLTSQDLSIRGKHQKELQSKLKAAPKPELKNLGLNSLRKLPSVQTVPGLEGIGYAVPIKITDLKKQKVHKSRSISVKKEAPNPKPVDPPLKEEEFPQLFENGDYFDLFYLELMKDILKGNLENIGKHRSSLKIPKESSQSKKPTISKSSMKNLELRPIDFDPFCEYSNIEGAGQSAKFPSTKPVPPLLWEILIESSSSHPRPKNSKIDHLREGSPVNLKHIGTIEAKRDPVTVRTYFGRGMEFRLFRYFYKIGEWNWLEKPQSVHYVHFTREEWVDWTAAQASVVGPPY